MITMCWPLRQKNSKTKQIKHFSWEYRSWKAANIEWWLHPLLFLRGFASCWASRRQALHHDRRHGIGHSICFSDFAQMLGRVRYVPHYHVCLQANNKRYEHVNAQSILLRQGGCFEGAVLKENEYSKFKAHIEATRKCIVRLFQWLCVVFRILLLWNDAGDGG